MAYIFSLLFFLLMTHWTYTFSLYSLLNSSENQNSESIHFKRLRRWSQNPDNDEVEIPLNETILSLNNFDDLTSLNSIVNSTLSNDFEIIESNSSIIENLNEFINSTSIIYLNENTTIIYPILRQDLTELNQTIPSITPEVFQDNQTHTNEMFFSSTIFNEVISTNESQSSSSIPIIFNQTTDQVESTTTTTIIHLDHINTTETILFNDSFTVTISDELIINSNIFQKDAIITNQDLNLNETETNLIETNENSNDTSILTPKSISIPICDYSCQCLKECPYGFEILNETCICNPPCKNYQCFGNDTCMTTDTGEPLCLRDDGSEYDRPVRCYQPRVAGYHDNNSRYYNRWYYNPDQDTCHLFVYRGLGGNENNFLTLHECHLECITCGPIPDSGGCLGHINMWYYDKNTNDCKEFEYSGCKGNENKFLKKEQCINTCVNRIFSF